MRVRNGVWTIDRPNGSPIACALSAAAHPNTMDDGAWVDWHTARVITPLKFRVDLTSTRATPLAMLDLGEDFFCSFRPRTNRIVWYRDPVSRCVHHSGAKERGGVHGRRYCRFCAESFSANNFVFQHLRHRHPMCRTPRDVWAVVDKL